MKFNFPLPIINRFSFESWRDFSAFDEHDPSTSSDRAERRWMQKQNENARKKLKKKEMLRLQKLVERAFALDPRIKRAEEEKERQKVSIQFSIHH